MCTWARNELKVLEDLQVTRKSSKNETLKSLPTWKDCLSLARALRQSPKETDLNESVLAVNRRGSARRESKLY